jgi:hypothetical protein
MQAFRKGGWTYSPLEHAPPPETVTIRGKQIAAPHFELYRAKNQSGRLRDRIFAHDPVTDTWYTMTR